MSEAPFLKRVRLRAPDKNVEAEVEEAKAVDPEYDPADFPAWYHDRLTPDEDDEDIEEGENEKKKSDPEEPSEPYWVSLAAVQTLDKLEFGKVTVLAGNNGSGKSTVLEAIAVAGGFNAEGGSKNLMFATHDTHSELHDELILEYHRRPKWGWFLRAETFYGMASHITEDDDPDYGLAAIFPDLHNRSHGESFLSLARSRFTGKGLYMLDEPESALSIQGQMALVAIMQKSLAKGSQFIISTHSPLLMAFPDAAVYELDHEEGITKTTFEKLTSTQLWRRFFDEPKITYADLDDS